MDSIDSWIDKDEVSKLAESLSGSPEHSKEWKQMESDGFAIAEKQGSQADKSPAPEMASPVVEKEQQQEPAITDQQRSVLAGASELAKGVGLFKKASPGSETIEPQSADQPKFSDRSSLGTFEQVQELCLKEIQSGEICAIDRDGDVLFDELNDSALTQFITRVMLQSSLMKINDGESDSMRIKTTGNTWVEFISVYSTRGIVLLAMKQTSPLTREQIRTLSEKCLSVINN